MIDIDEETAKNEIDTKPNIFSSMKLIASICFNFEQVYTNPHQHHHNPHFEKLACTKSSTLCTCS
jgi:hypothetical protein